MSIETCKNIDESLSKGHDNGEEFLSSLVKFAIAFQVEVDINQVSAGQKLKASTNLFPKYRSMDLTWKTIPEVMIGDIPSSINVPLLLANIILSQYNGSDVSDDTMPYSGIWLMTRKTINVN